MTHILIRDMIHRYCRDMIHRYCDVENDSYNFKTLKSFARESENYEDLKELFESIAESSGGKIREDYSGRGMYGANCWGVTGSDACKIIEIAGAHGVFDAHMDNMGRDFIVYWPEIKYTLAD